MDQLARDMGEVKTAVAVILERTGDIKDHETRLRALESGRAKLGQLWAGAAVLGAAAGYGLSYLPRPR